MAKAASVLQIVALHAMRRMMDLIPSVHEKRARLHDIINGQGVGGEWSSREAFVWVTVEDAEKIETGKIDEVMVLEEGIKALANQFRLAINFADMRPIGVDLQATRVKEGKVPDFLTLTDEGSQFSLYVDHVPPDEKGRGRICLACIGNLQS
jgi:hypothetical protein